MVYEANKNIKLCEKKTTRKVTQVDVTKTSLTHTMNTFLYFSVNFFCILLLFSMGKKTSSSTPLAKAEFVTGYTFGSMRKRRLKNVPDSQKKDPSQTQS